MDAQVAGLATSLHEKLSRLRTDARYLVSICGIPGSGKSSVARHVCDAINTLSADTPAQAPAIVVGMDGWHLTRKQLDAMDDPKEAHDRRGAAFTFDGKAFSDFVLSLRKPPTSTVRAPSFSHAAKDPVADGIPVEPWHRLVLIEGLYCCVEEPPWRAAAEVVDERWVVHVDETVARERLIARHVLTGVAKDAGEAAHRADHNDLPNGRWLLERLLLPVIRLSSLTDSTWAGSG